MRRSRRNRDAEHQPADTPEPEATGVSRRFFLAGTGVAGVAVVAASTVGPKLTGATPALAAPKGMGSKKGDLDTAELAAGLEVLAVGTYAAALAAANAGKLGPVPPAGANFVQVAQGQHQAYLDALNGLLQQGGRTAVTEPNAALKRTVDQRFGEVTDFVGAAELARDLEEISSATYLAAIPTLTNATAQTAGSILCVGQQRVATLNYVLGDYPVPEVFASTDKAVTS